MGSGDLLGHRARIAIRCDGLADLFQQRIEHQRRIADQPDPGFDILVEMVGIERRMDDGLALRHRDAEGGFGEGTADAEDHVGLGEEFRHRARHATPPEPSDSGCVSGNDDLPPRLVVTGIARRSASRFNCGQARA